MTEVWRAIEQREKALFDEYAGIDGDPAAYDWSTFDMEATKAWFLSEGPGYNENWPAFELALTHRNAWTVGAVEPWITPERFIGLYWDVPGGPCAWINKKGEVFSCHYATHEKFAILFLGSSEYELEKTHARVTTHICTMEEAWDNVYRPSKKMKDAVFDFITANSRAYGFLSQKGIV